MTGDKKIVGLWRDSATGQERNKQAPADSAASMGASARDSGPAPERDWLDMSALAEGEGDFEEWKRGHIAYFTRNGGYDPDMLLVCERFRLIEVLA